MGSEPARSKFIDLIYFRGAAWTIRRYCDGKTCRFRATANGYDPIWSNERLTAKRLKEILRGKVSHGD